MSSLAPADRQVQAPARRRAGFPGSALAFLVGHAVPTLKRRSRAGRSRRSPCRLTLGIGLRIGLVARVRLVPAATHDRVGHPRPRTLARTSCTRTISARPTMPRAVVAKVPSSRVAGRSRTSRWWTCGGPEQDRPAERGERPKDPEARRDCVRGSCRSRYPGSTIRVSGGHQRRWRGDGAPKVGEDFGDNVR